MTANAGSDLSWFRKSDLGMQSPEKAGISGKHRQAVFHGSNPRKSP